VSVVVSVGVAAWVHPIARRRRGCASELGENISCHPNKFFRHPVVFFFPFPISLAEAPKMALGQERRNRLENGECTNANTEWKQQ
jgi:hypothetical protein